jgi:Cytochrome P460
MKTTLCGVAVLVGAALVATSVTVVGVRSSFAEDKQDKYTLQIPGGLSFSEVKGYE